jgi:hypothetical protein
VKQYELIYMQLVVKSLHAFEPNGNNLSLPIIQRQICSGPAEDQPDILKIGENDSYSLPSLWHHRDAR